MDPSNEIEEEKTELITSQDRANISRNSVASQYKPSKKQDREDQGANKSSGGNGRYKFKHSTENSLEEIEEEEQRKRRVRKKTTTTAIFSEKIYPQR